VQYDVVWFTRKHYPRALSFCTRLPETDVAQRHLTAMQGMRCWTNMPFPTSEGAVQLDADNALVGFCIVRNFYGSENFGPGRKKDGKYCIATECKIEVLEPGLTVGTFLPGVLDAPKFLALAAKAQEQGEARVAHQLTLTAQAQSDRTLALQSAYRRYFVAMGHALQIRHAAAIPTDELEDCTKLFGAALPFLPDINAWLRAAAPGAQSAEPMDFLETIEAALGAVVVTHTETVA
jgi:hypothetical protein